MKENFVAERTEKKPNFFQRYTRETVGELRKVAWPTTREAWNLTKIVLIVLAAMSLILGLLDILFEQGITLLLAK
jgi:preprotein translocase subunit SecE